MDPFLDLGFSRSGHRPNPLDLSFMPSPHLRTQLLLGFLEALRDGLARTKGGVSKTSRTRALVTPNHKMFSLQQPGHLDIRVCRS